MAFLSPYARLERRFKRQTAPPAAAFTLAYFLASLGRRGHDALRQLRDGLERRRQQVMPDVRGQGLRDDDRARRAGLPLVGSHQVGLGGVTGCIEATVKSGLTLTR